MQLRRGDMWLGFDEADLFLVTTNATLTVGGKLVMGMLILWCQAHPEARVYLNFPGIGYGNLPHTQVLRLLMPLPDSVVIWEYFEG